MRRIAPLADIEILPARAAVLCCATAEPFHDVRAQLAAAVSAPVRWRAVLDALCVLGARTFLDAGPGDVQSGLVRRCLPQHEVVEVGDAAVA